MQKQILPLSPEVFMHTQPESLSQVPLILNAFSGQSAITGMQDPSCRERRASACASLCEAS